MFRLLRILPFLILVLFSLSSCDEFILKKTVSVQYMKGDISFDPASETLSGKIRYEIKNNQQNALKEIYLVSHPKLVVDFVTFQNEIMRFEQGLGYGLGVFRVKIPAMPSSSNAAVEVHFHIDGPVEEDRFLLTRDNVFMDAKKIWLPVPFAEIPRFYYSLKVHTSEDYFIVLGGQKKEENIKNGKRVELWESEIDDILQTGNIFIANFNRTQDSGITVYSFQTNNITRMIDYAKQSVSILSNAFGRFPFSSISIVNEVFQYQDMEEFIDGEAMANIIQISPDLTSNELQADEVFLKSADPEIPRSSGWKIFETLSHEIGHAFVPGMLKFEDDSYLDSESFAEYLGLTVIGENYPEIYNKFVNRNRIELINLALAGKTEERQFQYLFGVQCLHTVFQKKPELFFYYLKMMIEKYAYTEIRLEEALSTAKELSADPLILKESGSVPENLPLEAMTLWPENRFYNASVSAISFPVTNKISRKKTVIEEKKLITVLHNFPVGIIAQLIVEEEKSVSTNKFYLEKSGSTNLVYSGKIRSAVLSADLDPLEENLYDNRIQFTGTDRLSLYGDVLTHYYAGRKAMIPADIRFSQSATLAEGWRNIDDDREKTLEMKADIRFVADSVSENDSELYLQAYKMVNNKPFSYIIIRANKNKDGSVEFTSVIDPLI